MLTKKDPYKSRFRIIQVVFFLAALTLVFRAFYLQVVDQTLQHRAETTAIHKHNLYPARGLIYDRDSNLLVTNDAVYDLMVTYNQISPDMDTAYFCRLLDIQPGQFEEYLDKTWTSKHYSRAVPFVFMPRLSSKTITRFQESLYEFPGFFVQRRIMRRYPYPLAANVLGYISEVSPSQIKRSVNEYAMGDYIGSIGLEATYEPLLKGQKGAEYVLKDNMGRIVESYKNGKMDSAAIAGIDLYSSLDVELQAYGEQLMQNKVGSIVALDPKTGEVLTLVTTPSYDPNRLIIHRNRGKEFKRLLKDSLNPFFDRALMAQYPPGSIFKTVVALVGLQEGVIHPNSLFSCEYGYYYGGRLYGCHGHPTATTVAAGIQHSCNSYFWQTFRRIIDKYGFYKPQQGLDSLEQHLRQFGLGQPLGIDLPNEASGNIPTSAYYDKIYPKEKGSWKSPTIMSVGIGQGEIQLTTLQMANLAAIIANKGWFITPHLIRDMSSKTNIDRRYQEKNRVSIDSTYFDHVIEGMSRAVTGGTATIAYIPKLEVCGKTGTSQNPHGEDHSVFFAFAPRHDPKIAVAVYVENAGWGASYAAPIASLIIEKMINKEIHPSRKWIEERMLQADLISQP